MTRVTSIIGGSNEYVSDRVIWNSGTTHDRWNLSRPGSSSRVSTQTPNLIREVSSSSMPIILRMRSAISIWDIGDISFFIHGSRNNILLFSRTLFPEDWSLYRRSDNEWRLRWNFIYNSICWACMCMGRKNIKTRSGK